jgi:hypothetical protein
MVVLTLEGCQFIGIRAYENSELTVMSRAAAVLCGMDRAVLSEPLKLKGPASTPIRATEICTMEEYYRGTPEQHVELADAAGHGGGGG